MASSTDLVPPSPPFTRASRETALAPDSLRLTSAGSDSTFMSMKGTLVTAARKDLCAFLVLRAYFGEFKVPFSETSEFSLLESTLTAPPLCFETHAMTAVAATLNFGPTVQRLVSEGFSTPESTPGPTSIVTWSTDFVTVFMTIARLRP